MDFGKGCTDDNGFIFDRIFIILAGNEDSDKILDGFDLGADGTIQMRFTGLSVSCRHVMVKMLSGR